jgi:hypothetical protein
VSTIIPGSAVPAEPPSLADVLPIALVLREVLARRGEVTIRVADLSDVGFMGRTWFATQSIELDAGLPDEEWRPTLVHELLHLLRGPAGVENAAVEEVEVERLTLEIEHAARIRTTPKETT